ncbi:STKc_PknB_like and WD40 domain-containing protein [Ktedonobacteria bacterium brp13]|nr:STKc_PknB_like and WD40 domain-containing protein [Ktedonobacteria bacterium brp13]
MIQNSVLDWQDKILGNYSMKRLLGRGGMGEVWLAEDVDLRRMVAIKLLPPVLRDQQDFLDAFAREAQMAASLEHPHILAVHDFGSFVLDDSDIVTYLVTPLITGGSLQDRMRGRQDLLPFSLAISYLEQAADAIDFAHSKQLIHRDIKPANMLMQEQWLYLSDFGIARLLSTDTYRSHTSSMVGTPRYMAPEQILGRPVPASDLYSLAVVAYQLLAGCLPFPGTNFTDILRQHVQDPPPEPSQFNALISKQMDAAILRALAKQPADRHPSCRVFVQELKLGWQSGSLSTATIDDPDATLLAPGHKRSSRSPAASGIEALKLPAPHYQDESDLGTTWQEEGDDIAQVPTVMEGQYAGTVGKGVQARKLGRRTMLLGGVSLAVLLAGGGYALDAAWIQQQQGVIGPQQFQVGKPLLKLTGHANSVYNLRWHFKGHYLMSGGDDWQLMLWDIDQLLSTLSSTEKQPSSISTPLRNWVVPGDGVHVLGKGSFDWTLDGENLVVIASSEGVGVDVLATVNVFGVQSAPVVGQPLDTGYLNWIACSPTNKTRVATDETGSIATIWDIDSSNGQTRNGPSFNPLSLTDVIASKNLLAVNWSRDGMTLLGLYQSDGGGDTDGHDIQHYIVSWDANDNHQSGKSFQLPFRPSYMPSNIDPLLSVGEVASSLINAPDQPSRWLVKVKDTAIIYDVVQQKAISMLRSEDADTLKPANFFSNHTQESVAWATQMGPLAWSPNGRYIVGSYVGSENIYVWDLQKPQVRKDGSQIPTMSWSIKGWQRSPLSDIAWSPDGRYIATSSIDSTVMLWKVDAN